MSARGRPRTLPWTVRDLIIGMHERAGMGFSDIARRLNALGIVTPTREGAWHPRQVQRVLEQVAHDRATRS